MIEMIKELKQRGLKVDLTKNRSETEEREIMNVILHMISQEPIQVIETYKDEKEIVTAIILGGYEQEKGWTKKLEKMYVDNDDVTWDTKRYENKPEQLNKLMENLGMKEAFQKYCQSFLPAKGKCNVVDSDKRKEAEKLFNILLPVINDKGYLLLTEDSIGNSVWAYVIRKNKTGSFSYGIYRQDVDGNVSLSTIVSPAAVNSLGTIIGNTIQNYEGTFTSLCATQAAQRLWLWNLSRKFEMQNLLDDYNPTEVNKLLKNWVVENVGKTIKIEGEERKPIYIQQVREKVRIGIWVNDLKHVFSKLEVDMKVSEWIREAMKERWLITTVIKENEDGTKSERAGYNPSDMIRKVYERKSRSERVYLLNFSKKEEKTILKNYKKNLKNSIRIKKED